METRELGPLKLPVTRLGLGLAALGRPGYINLGHASDLEANYEISAMEERTHTVLDAAWKSGIRYFDAARSYGRAEEFLGSWLRGSEHRGGLVVGSKWGYTYTAGWNTEAEKHEVKEHSLPVLNRQIAESRDRLGDRLNLYQIHSATHESGVLTNEALLRRLAELKAEGLSIGLTLSGPRQSELLCEAMTIEVDGERLFDCVQATWNLLERSAGPQLEEAHRGGMGVIVKEGLANGRLTSRNTEPGCREKMAVLEGQARRLSTTVDAVALAGVLAQPWVDVVLSGAATTEHLHSNLAALEVRWDSEAEEALHSIQEKPGEYWHTRAGLRWN